MSKTLEASIDVDASPEQVWKVVSDLKRMGEWSPQCKKMKVFGGDVRKGTTTLNINRKGLLVWPTTAKVVEFEPNKAIAFRIVENKTIWSYTLTPRKREPRSWRSARHRRARAPYRASSSRTSSGASNSSTWNSSTE